MADVASLICGCRPRIPGGLGLWAVMGVHEQGAGTGGRDDVQWVVVKDVGE